MKPILLSSIDHRNNNSLTSSRASIASPRQWLNLHKKLFNNSRLDRPARLLKIEFRKILIPRAGAYVNVIVYASFWKRKERIAATRWEYRMSCALSCMSFDRFRHEVGKAFYHVNVSKRTRNDKVILSLVTIHHSHCVRAQDSRWAIGVAAQNHYNSSDSPSLYHGGNLNT